jgi:hypothetical protein
MRTLGILGFMCIVLSGCAGPEALTQQQVKDNVTAQSGYPGCAACSKVKSFSSPIVINISSRASEGSQSGWLNAKVQLVSTNYTPQNLPKYRLRLEMVNNGIFQSGVEVLIKDGSGKLKNLSIIPFAQDDHDCFSNIGSGCSWTQVVELPTDAVQNAFDHQQGLSLFVGVEITRQVQSSDGYTPTRQRTQELVGKAFTVTTQALAGFIEGIQLQGGQLPSVESERTNTRVIIQSAEERSNANTERLIRERPLKQKLGTQICRTHGRWISVGFVEQATQDKLKIRISDVHRAGNSNLQASNFKEQIIWDIPDAWELCSNNQGE